MRRLLSVRTFPLRSAAGKRFLLLGLARGKLRVKNETAAAGPLFRAGL
jgi:hypothetical protein